MKSYSAIPWVSPNSGLAILEAILFSTRIDYSIILSILGVWHPISTRIDYSIPNLKCQMENMNNRNIAI